MAHALLAIFNLYLLASCIYAGITVGPSHWVPSFLYARLSLEKSSLAVQSAQMVSSACGFVGLSKHLASCGLTSAAGRTGPRIGLCKMFVPLSVFLPLCDRTQVYVFDLQLGVLSDLRGGSVCRLASFCMAQVETHGLPSLQRDDGV